MIAPALPRADARSVLVTVLWCVLVPLGGIAAYLLGGAVLFAVLGRDSVLAMTVLGVLVAVAVLLLRRRRPRWFGLDAAHAHSAESAPGRSRLRTLGLYAGATVLAFVAGQSLALTLYVTLGSSGFEQVTSTQRSSGVVLLLVLAVLAAPLGEEALFRGLIFPLLRRKVAMLPATILTTGFFALVHGNIVQIASALPVAVLLAVVYERTRSVGACVAVHMAFNLGAMLVPTSVIAPFVNPLTAALLVAGSLMLSVRMVRKQRPEVA